MVSILDTKFGALLAAAQINDWLNNWNGTPGLKKHFGFFCIECLST